MHNKIIQQFTDYLMNEEKAPSTISKYLKDLQQFINWLQNNAISKEILAQYKEHLTKQKRKPETVNGKLTALNKFLSFLGKHELKIKYQKVQRQFFYSSSKELTKAEYEKLLTTAEKLGKERLLLLMQTICATGIRVSEVKYITAEAIKAGKAEIFLKGKIRTILLPGKLCKKLKKYAKKQKTTSGEIFLTRSGKGIGRKQIWAEMKALCKKAGIEGSKVFPHSLRHLFARTFYNYSKDISRLADILGHSSVETTRIYLISTDKEHLRTMDKLQLIT